MFTKEISIQEIEKWLRQEDENLLEMLWKEADKVRQSVVGKEVHLRGLIEISNHCIRQCTYCGLNVLNHELERYRMPENEIIACAHEAINYGYGTVVIQAGEDYGIETGWLEGIIRRIKNETPLAVTLSLGERPYEDLECWRNAGADRYLLRFETSNAELYNLIHPPKPGQYTDRFRILEQLKRLGYETGSGVMIGIPGQNYTDLARDIALFREYDLDMIGVGPYIPNPASPLGSGKVVPKINESDQVPNTELMTYKVVALTRIVRPDANIPSTTALATMNRESGRELGLQRGANVVMPNMTPVEYRNKYEIYPGKACINETAEQCKTCLRTRISSIGRCIGQGQGSRKR